MRAFQASSSWGNEQVSRPTYENLQSLPTNGSEELPSEDNMPIYTKPTQPTPHTIQPTALTPHSPIFSSSFPACICSWPPPDPRNIQFKKPCIHSSSLFITKIEPYHLFYFFFPPLPFHYPGTLTPITDRGEGANHAIVDVQDFADLVAGPHLAPTQGPASFEELRRALDAYEDAVVERARPGVLASRRACLDAHEWGKIGEASPLLTRRAMKLDFDEE